MSKGKRGIGLNKPCIRCGAEVPSVFVSPVQPGLCGKCTDEALRAKKKQSEPRTKEIFLEKAPLLRMTLLLAMGLVLGFALALILSAAAPGAWDSLTEPLRDLFG